MFCNVDLKLPLSDGETFMRKGQEKFTLWCLFMTLRESQMWYLPLICWEVTKQALTRAEPVKVSPDKNKKMENTQGSFVKKDVSCTQGLLQPNSPLTTEKNKHIYGLQKLIKRSLCEHISL